MLEVRRAIERARLPPALLSLDRSRRSRAPPIDQALTAAAEQADDAQAAAHRVLRAQAAGETLAAASHGGRGRSPSCIAGLLPSPKRAGGRGFARLADHLEARQALKQKFTLALIYPALVTVVAPR
jgi:general secretion pathway protein F